MPGVAVGDRYEADTMSERCKFCCNATGPLIAVVLMSAECDYIELPVRRRGLRPSGRRFLRTRERHTHQTCNSYHPRRCPQYPHGNLAEL
jgi:hypothetical protein